MIALSEQLAAAKAAYAENPTAENKAAALELVRAVAAEKRERESVSAIELDAQKAAALAAMREREESSKLAEKIERARRLYSSAEEWPRCLENWPATAAERAAQKLIDQHGV